MQPSPTLHMWISTGISQQDLIYQCGKSASHLELYNSAIKAQSQSSLLRKKRIFIRVNSSLKAPHAQCPTLSFPGWQWYLGLVTLCDDELTSTE